MYFQATQFGWQVNICQRVEPGKSWFVSIMYFCDFIDPFLLSPFPPPPHPFRPSDPASDPALPPHPDVVPVGAVLQEEMRRGT